MATPRLIRIESISQLRDANDAWDDLWQRSEVALPIARAELIAQWIEAAALRRQLHALAIENDGQFVAALPLLDGRLKRLLSVGELPSNHWSWAGDILLDPSADLGSVLATMADALAHLPVRLLWLEGVALASPRWTRFAAALEAHGLDVVGRELFHVGQVEISHDWDAYRAGWSANHRHHMRRMQKRVQVEPGVRLTVISDAPPEQVDILLRRGFEVETRGWKGSQGTAVLNSPTTFAYYCRQARQLAEWGQLQLTFLELADRAIAFEYGWNAKGVYCSPKVGYDEEFSRLSAGQVLRHELLKQFFADPRQRVFDFVGPLADATAKWITNAYPVGRLVVSTKRRGSRSLVRLLRRRWSVNCAALRPASEPRRAATSRACLLGHWSKSKLLSDCLAMALVFCHPRRCARMAVAIVLQFPPDVMPESPSIKAVVFDLDGLMFNTEALYQQVGGELLRRRGKTFGPDLLDRIMGRRTNVALQMMIDWHDLPDSVESLVAESTEIFSVILDTQLAQMPGLSDLLDSLEAADIPKAVATSSSRAFTLRVLGKFDLARRFKLLLTAEDVTEGKPDPEIYRTAAARLEVEPRQMMVLEDSHNGCQAAIAAGAYAVAVPGGHSLSHDFNGANLIADTLADPRIYSALGL